MVGTQTISIHSDHFYVSKSIRHRSDRYSTFQERVPRNHCNRKGSSAGLSKWSAGDKGPRKISHIKEVLCPKTELSTRAEPADVTPPPNQSLDMVFTTPPLDNMASMGSLGSDGRSMFYRTLKKYCLPSSPRSEILALVLRPRLSMQTAPFLKHISAHNEKTRASERCSVRNRMRQNYLGFGQCHARRLVFWPVITSWRRR